MTTIDVTLKTYKRGDAVSSAKRLVVWTWNDEVVYANVSIKLPPPDDFDTFGDRAASKMGAGSEFFRENSILYADAIEASDLTEAKAHKAAADILIAELKPRGATRKAKRPAGITLRIHGDWPAGVPSVFGPDGASPGTDPVADFVQTYLGGATLEPALAKLIAEHAEHGETFLMHPATFEIELGGEHPDDGIAWFGHAAGGGRIGLDGAAVVFEDSEGGRETVADSVAGAILTWSERAGADRLAAAKAWLPTP